MMNLKLQNAAGRRFVFVECDVVKLRDLYVFGLL